ncbi:MAG: alpha-glucosidase [Chitinophagales bacterium]|nr:alpha-glucosidase [Chitinophagales bacterium]
MIKQLLTATMLLLVSMCSIAQSNKAEPWYTATTVYQIYPRSFYDTDGDGIGDLKGVIEKLDYIKASGFETIWLSPFFSSPQMDFGYDISDYRGVAPEYGDTAMVTQLITAVHAKGMKIVFDMVMNHTSDQHPWFQEARKSKDNPKHDWYVWQDGKGKRPPNNWKSQTGGSGWHYDSVAHQYYWASFLSFQPDLNYHNPEMKTAMLDNLRYWLDKGVDGFRLDIFNSIYEDSAFHNNPFALKVVPSETNPNGFFQKMKYTINHPQSFAFANELRAVLEEYKYPPRFAVGEVFGSHEVLRQFMGEGHDGLNMVFLFEILDFKFKAKYFCKVLQTFEKEFPHPYMPTYVFSNHDRKRSISRMDNDTRKAKLLALFQMTARGVPFTYQGEEIGMEQAYIPLKQAKDILAQKYSRIPQFIANMSSESLNRDECRTPMQWDSTTSAGFSISSNTWLPVNNNYHRINVAAEQRDSNSLWQVYRQLLQLRKSSKALQSDTITVLKKMPKNVLAFQRSNAGETYTVIINFSKKRKNVDGNEGSLLYSIGNTKLQTDQIELGPYAGLIIKSN